MYTYILDYAYIYINVFLAPPHTTSAHTYQWILLWSWSSIIYTTAFHSDDFCYKAIVWDARCAPHQLKDPPSSYHGREAQVQLSHRPCRPLLYISLNIHGVKTYGVTRLLWSHKNPVSVTYIIQYILLHICNNNLIIQLNNTGCGGGLNQRNPQCVWTPRESQHWCVCVIYVLLYYVM